MPQTTVFCILILTMVCAPQFSATHSLDSGAEYLNEHFEGPDFPPTGWTRYTSHPYETYYWTQWYSQRAGGTLPEARVNQACWSAPPGYEINLLSPPLDTTLATSLVLQFKHCIVLDTGAMAHDFKIFATTEPYEWTEITPWENPPFVDMGPETVNIDISEFISTETRVAFHIWVPYWADCITFWAVDDVRIFEPRLERQRRLKINNMD